MLSAGGIVASPDVVGREAILPGGFCREPDGGDRELSPADPVVVRVAWSDSVVRRLHGRGQPTAGAMANRSATWVAARCWSIRGGVSDSGGYQRNRWNTDVFG